MHELDRVFDGDDVTFVLRVDFVDDRGKSRRFSASRRSGNQHQTARAIRLFQNHRRQTQVFGIGNFGWNHAHRSGDRTFVPVSVDTKTRSGVGGGVSEIEFEIVFKTLDLFVRQNIVNDALQNRRANHFVLADLFDVAVNANTGRFADRQMQIRAFGIENVLQQFVDMDFIEGSFFDRLQSFDGDFRHLRTVLSVSVFAGNLRPRNQRTRR